MMKTVIIVGGGLAGLSAAIEAHEGNVRVILIEKESKIGGNSIKASSGINAMISKEDRALFIQDTLESGGGESQVELVHKLVDDSRTALDWLMKQADSLHLSLVSQCGGHSVARTHRCPSENGKPVPVGWKLIESLKSRLNNLPNVIILTQTRVLELIVRQERICGVRLRDPLGEREMVANAVILTSGGFGGQTSKQSDGQVTLLNEYAPQLVNKATTNGPWANGDGIRLGLSVGASTRNMERVQLHPTGFVDPNHPLAPTKFLAPESLRAYGAILLNGQGKRFVNELGLRQHVTEQILAQADTLHDRPQSWMNKVLPENYQAAYLVLTEEAVENFGRSTLSFYASKGFFIQAQGVHGLAKELDVEESQLDKMLEEYDQRNDSFGKSLFPCKFKNQETYWVALVTPVVHYTMGGLRMNTEASLLTEKDEVIKGLYGAGEVTGGVHGRNRLAGNSLLECVVYGRTAGGQAAVYAHQSERL